MKYVVIAVVMFGAGLAGFGVYALFLGTETIAGRGRINQPTSGTLGLIYMLIAILAFGCAAVVFYWALRSRKNETDK